MVVCTKISLIMYFHRVNWTSVDGTPSQIPAFYLNKAFAKFDVATPTGLGGDAFTRSNIVSPLTLTLGQGRKRKVAQCPLNYMTYAPAKFEVAMSNGLGGNAFTRNISFDIDLRSRSHETLPYISCDLYTCKVLKLLRPMVKEMHCQENYYLIMIPRSYEMLPSTLGIT